ncbi:MAG: OmpA family protein [Cytophagaceae bacterium]
MKNLFLFYLLFFFLNNSHAQNLTPAFVIQREVDPLTDARVAFSADGQFLGYGTLRGELVIFSLASKQTVWSIKAFEKSVLAIAFSPDGSKVIAGDQSGMVKIFNLSTSAEIKSISAHKHAVMAISWNPDGYTFLTGSRDNTIKVWDASTYNSVLDIKDITGNVRMIEFSPNGRNIIAVTSALSKGIRYFDMQNGNEVNTINAPNTLSVTISPDETIMATANLDKNIFLWDPANGSSLGKMSGHTKFLYDVDFSPGGQLLISGSNDKTIKIWDIKSRVALYSFTAHKSDLVDIEYSPDGKYIASTSWDNTLKIWGLAGLNLPEEVLYKHEGGTQPLPLPQTEKEVLDNTVQNLQFERGKSVITPASFSALDKLYDLLKNRKTYRLIISGHTDNQGDPRLDYQLSIDRANAVKNYLVSKGIKKDKIVAVGYGGTKPIADNRTEEGRSKNRRVEFSITEMKK